MEKGGVSRPVSSRRVSDFVTDDKGRIDFDIVRSSRKTLGIHIGEGGQVLIKAPAWVSRSQIREAVLGKSPWIPGKGRSGPQRRRFKDYPPICSGRTIFISGTDLPFVYPL